jgi:RAD51-like protein 2
MVTRSQIFSTLCPPVDKLLSGGLSRGHILEISGPPGTPKETLAVNIVKSFVEANEEVLFVGKRSVQK